MSNPCFARDLVTLYDRNIIPEIFSKLWREKGKNHYQMIKKLRNRFSLIFILNITLISILIIGLILLSAAIIFAPEFITLVGVILFVPAIMQLIVIYLYCSMENNPCLKDLNMLNELMGPIWSYPKGCGDEYFSSRRDEKLGKLAYEWQLSECIQLQDPSNVDPKYIENKKRKFIEAWNLIEKFNFLNPEANKKGVGWKYYTDPGLVKANDTIRKSDESRKVTETFHVHHH